MIEILFERANINVGKLPVPIRVPATFFIGQFRRHSFIGNLWDLAYIFTGKMSSNAERIDDFEWEKEIDDCRMYFKIRASTEELEKDFVQQYWNKFLMFSPSLDVIKRVVGKLFIKKTDAKTQNKISTTTIGSLLTLFNI